MPQLQLHGMDERLLVQHRKDGLGAVLFGRFGMHFDDQTRVQTLLPKLHFHPRAKFYFANPFFWHVVGVQLAHCHREDDSDIGVGRFYEVKIRFMLCFGHNTNI